MQKKNKKICICSDTLQHITGLGKTALRIAKGFYDNGYDVCYFVLTGQDSNASCEPYYGEMYKDFLKNVPIFNCQLHSAEKYKLFDNYIMYEKPDIVLSLLDPWNLDQIETSVYRDTYWWIAYCLFETPEYPEFVKIPSYIKNKFPVRSIFEPLRKADLCIPVTKMGKVILEGKGIIPSDNVYLGIDFDLRCQDEKLTKKDIFGEAHKDSFIFMVVGRNSERKKLDKTVEAFAKFLSNKSTDKFKLYIHTDYTENVSGTDIITQGTDLGVINNIMLPICFQNNQIMLDVDLYKRYKVADAYIGLSAGEGFGYGYIEAMMHGKPIIYLNYGGHKEYCNNFGYSVKPQAYYHARDIYMRWALPDIDEVVKYMQYCVDNKNDELLKEEIEYVKNNFDWDSIIIPKLIKTIEDNHKPKRKLYYNLKKII